MKHIGLFEGIGGFSLAAKWMNWNTIAWCEIDPFCQKVLNYHFPKADKIGDIKNADFTIYRGKCDLLTGGFPCQPYSVAGKRLGKADERHLFPEMLRAVREIQPNWIVGENVGGLVSWNRGLVFDEVQTDLENEGYEVQSFILPACAVGAPHRRDRIWIVAQNPNYLRCRSDERKEESEIGQFRFIGTRNNERVPTNNAEIGIIANAEISNHRQFEGEPNTRQESELGNGAISNNVRHANGERLEQQGKVGELEGLRLGSPSRNGSERWANFPTQSPICRGDDGLSDRLDGISFSSFRRESIRAYGNAIVPQVAYEIFKAIQKMEDYETI